MEKGYQITVRTNADFLNKAFGTNYKLWLKSTYELVNIINFDKLKSLVNSIDIRMGADNEPLCLSYDISKIGRFIVFICAMKVNNS